MSTGNAGRRAQLASYPFAMCRVLVGNHVPAAGYPVIKRTRGGGYDQMFICANCGAEVHRFRDRHGFRTGSPRYKYEKGYLIEEGGTLTTSEKAEMFLAAATESVAKIGWAS